MEHTDCTGAGRAVIPVSSVRALSLAWIVTQVQLLTSPTML